MVEDNVKVLHTSYIDEKSETKKKGLYVCIKRIADIIVSAAGMIILSPLLLIIMIAIRIEDGEKSIYTHERIGLNGKRFKIYKFRSMKTGIDNLEEFLTPDQYRQLCTEFKIDNDPRITKIGSFLRKTSLDELPQLYNILKGDLSLIGPRPIVEKELEHYDDKINKFLSVKPGLTGYWQAYARNNATYESGIRQNMELFYIDNFSFGMDCKIFFKTIEAIVKKTGN